MSFQMSVHIKQPSIGKCVEYAVLPFVYTSCTIDLMSSAGIESKIHVKLCKIRVKSSGIFSRPN